jgi:hypothetical protein
MHNDNRWDEPLRDAWQAFTRGQNASAKSASELMATISTAMIQRDDCSVRDHRLPVCTVAYTMQRYG